MHISIISPDGDTVYLDWGAKLAHIDNMGSYSIYVSIYRGNEFVNYAILTVYVFHGGEIE